MKRALRRGWLRGLKDGDGSKIEAAISQTAECPPGAVTVGTYAVSRCPLGTLRLALKDRKVGARAGQAPQPLAGEMLVFSVYYERVESNGAVTAIGAAASNAGF